MKEILPNIFAVEVPNVIADPHLYRVNNESIMLKWTDVKHPLNPHDIVRIDRYYGDLKDYKWPEILFTSKECTEEQAVGVAESTIGWDIEPPYIGDRIFKNYTKDKNWFFTACESIQSLLRSHGLDENKNYLLLKKTDNL